MSKLKHLYFYIFHHKKISKLKVINKQGNRISIDTLFNDNTVFEGNNDIGRVDLEDSYVGFGTNIANGGLLYGCRIGKFCSIASDVKMVIGRHPTNFVSTSQGFYTSHNKYVFPHGTNNIFKETAKTDNGYNVEIGNDVWIGKYALIKGGVKIGDGAIIGMGAVVVKNVPPYAIVGGNPARIIRYRFDKDTITKLLEIKWWDWDLEAIHNRKNDFSDIQNFVEKYHI